MRYVLGLSIVRNSDTLEHSQRLRCSGFGNIDVFFFCFGIWFKLNFPLILIIRQDMIKLSEICCFNLYFVKTTIFVFFRISSPIKIHQSTYSRFNKLTALIRIKQIHIRRLVVERAVVRCCSKRSRMLQYQPREYLVSIFHTVYFVTLFFFCCSACKWEWNGALEDRKVARSSNRLRSSQYQKTNTLTNLIIVFCLFVWIHSLEHIRL